MSQVTRYPWGYIWIYTYIYMYTYGSLEQKDLLEAIQGCSLRKKRGSGEMVDFPNLPPLSSRTVHPKDGRKPYGKKTHHY